MGKRKIALPYTGELRLFLYSFFQDLGLETIYVPKSALNFKELSGFSSDEWCYSLKLIYHDFLKALQMGANTIIALSHGVFKKLGPCKLPHVSEHRIENLLKKTTKKEIDYYVFYFTSLTFELSTMDILRKMGYLKNPMDILRFKRMLGKAKLKLKMFDDITTMMREIRAREEKKGKTFKVYENFVQKLEREQDSKKLENLFYETKKKLMAVEKDALRKPKKIAIVGDYLSIISEFPSFDLENFISDKFAIEIYQPHTLYRYYFDKNFLCSEKIKQFEKRYKGYWIGGSDSITFKIIVKALEKNVDGIIQLRNFGCIPEQMIVESVNQMKQELEDFPPFLSISFDEHTGSEGVKTRIEAFCNTLLRSQK